MYFVHCFLLNGAARWTNKLFWFKSFCESYFIFRKLFPFVVSPRLKISLYLKKIADKLPINLFPFIPKIYLGRVNSLSNHLV